MADLLFILLLFILYHLLLRLTIVWLSFTLYEAYPMVIEKEEKNLFCKQVAHPVCGVSKLASSSLLVYVFIFSG